jgi:UDP-N-acetylmuramoyl-tripeptide--D-alanyl-D-alanine ligase
LGAPVKLLASHAAEITGGALHGPDVTTDGAAIDSRALRPGALFVPVVAERDGHDFIDAALEAGAAAYLTARPPGAGTAVHVADTGAALASLGAWAREQLTGPVVGITGSAGKTSTKDMLGAVLQPEFPTAVSERSFNNELGVPLTLVNADDGTRGAVLEMGARGFGHIAWLCELARPDVGIVTNVASAHTEMFGDLDGVARAKGELVAALPATGTAVLNANDERVMLMSSRSAAPVLTFGVEEGDVRATGATVDEDLRVSFRLESAWGSGDVRLDARGKHQAANAAAAAAAGLSIGVPFDRVVTRLETAPLSPWRMEVTRTPSGALLINDAYNANPASMMAALEALRAAPAKRKIAVVGPMLELGGTSDEAHAGIGRLADRLRIRLIAVGAPAYDTEDVDTIEDALALLTDIGEGDAVLIKASRAAGLELLASRLLEGAEW